MAKKFDKLLERATEPSLLEADWELIMSCVDTVRSGEVPAKNALSSVKKRFHSDNPHVSHHALMVLEALVKNCGEKVHKEVATKEFMEDMKHLANDSGDKVKDKILELIQCWSYAFRDKSEYKIINDTHNLMKLEGFSFPPLRESDAMFDAEAAPEWADSNKCYRCRAEFGLFTRKHHCRNCGQIFCDKCSSKYMPLPHIGIENDVRVCETCYDTIRNKLTSLPVPKSTSTSKSTVSDSAETVTSSKPTDGKSEEEIREEEELQLALAISQSEAEEKERRKQRRMVHSYGTHSNSTDSSPSHYKDPVVNGSSNSSSVYTGAMDRTSDPNESEGELAKYLNRSYWESRRSEQKRGILRNSPTPSAPVAPTDVEQTPESSSIEGKLNDSSNVVNDNETNGDAPDFTQFVENLRTKIEVFVNRIRNDQVRGRSVVSDSGIQSMFVNLTSLHTQLIKNMSDLDDRRGYFESLQDKLAQIKDAREAVDALREEHEQRRQAELMEMQRQRQIQMAAKLDVMRHKKHEMLEQQRLMVMQKMEEQRREMELRRQMQIQQQQQGSMVGVNVYAPPAGHTYGNMPVQQVYATPTPQQQYDAYNMQQMASSLPQGAQPQYMSGPLSNVQPQYQQNAMGEQAQYVVSQQQPQAYHPAQHVQYYGQPNAASPVQQQQYGPMVYPPQQHVQPPVVPQMQHSNPQYQMIASNAPSGHIPGPVPGSAATAVVTPMHYVHQTYVGPQMTPTPQPQFQSPTHVAYADPQYHGSVQMQQQPHPPEAQLISFD